MVGLNLSFESGLGMGAEVRDGVGVDLGLVSELGRYQAWMVIQNSTR